MGVLLGGEASKWQIKMKLNFCKIGVVVVALSVVSCSGFNKLRKSNNPELKYQKALEYFNQGKYNRTAMLLYDISSIYGGSSKGDTIAYYYGAALYRDGDFEGSGSVFDNFRRYYPRSPFLEDAEYMYAKGIYYTSPRPERDQTNTMRAISAITEYLNRYPESTKKEALEDNLKELQQKLYDKSLMSSRLYYDIGYYNSAVTALQNALELYPETNHRELILYLIVRSHYMYARNSVESKQRERYLAMQDAYYNFVSEYPQSQYSKDVEKMQAEAKKYLARFSEMETKAPSDTVVSDRERRRLERIERRKTRVENRELREEDKELSAMDKEIDNNSSSIVRKPKADKETRRTENTKAEHGN